MIDPVVDVAVDGGQGALDLGWGRWLVGGDERAQEPVVDFGLRFPPERGGISYKE